MPEAGLAAEGAECRQTLFSDTSIMLRFMASCRQLTDLEGKDMRRMESLTIVVMLGACTAHVQYEAASTAGPVSRDLRSDLE